MHKITFLKITNNLSIPLTEIEILAVRSQGSGGQNVNKVATAIHLRFDIQASSLPEHYKAKLLQLKDSRISSEGVIIIKAQRFNSQVKNREDALNRLREMIKSVTITLKTRVPILSGCGARPSLDNCLNFSLLTGLYFLNCLYRLLPVAGNVAGAGSWCFCVMFTSLENKNGL